MSELAIILAITLWLWSVHKDLSIHDNFDPPAVVAWRLRFLRSPSPADLDCLSTRVPLISVVCRLRLRPPSFADYGPSYLRRRATTVPPTTVSRRLDSSNHRRMSTTVPSTSAARRLRSHYRNMCDYRRMKSAGNYENSTEFLVFRRISVENHSDSNSRVGKDLQTPVTFPAAFLTKYRRKKVAKTGDSAFVFSDVSYAVSTGQTGGGDSNNKATKATMMVAAVVEDADGGGGDDGTDEGWRRRQRRYALRCSLQLQVSNAEN
ncbi:hypothetical protein M5K25_027273 [Dendrobium thyrsiflorum]|uniref:Uncharacterized protein n=1 Tax=Dendrobium thyrsiflorum TaxID=117978 RepID=A0ABD0TZE3_DENTH